MSSDAWHALLITHARLRDVHARGLLTYRYRTGPIDERCAIAERRVTHDVFTDAGFNGKPRLHAEFERLSFAAVCGGTVTYAGSTCTSPVCTVYCAINCIQNKYWCPFVRPVIIISDWSHSQKSTRSSGMFVFSLLVRPWRRGKRYVCPYQRPEVVWGE